MSQPQTFKLALITGATSGIGEQLSYLIATTGTSLILHGRDSDKLLKLAMELRKRVPVEVISADLNCSAGQELVAQVIKTQVPDLIINNAGFGLYGHVLDYGTDEQLSLLRVNAEAVVRLCIEGARQLKATGKPGVVMNISSVAGFIISPRLALYSASKALITQFSESFDYEMRPFGIRILTACPGVVRTNFRARASGTVNKLEPQQLFEISMSKENAAGEIWQQIQRGQTVYTFNWFYRLVQRLTHYILPKAIVAWVMDRSMQRLEK